MYGVNTLDSLAAAKLRAPKSADENGRHPMPTLSGDRNALQRDVAAGCASPEGGAGCTPFAAVNSAHRGRIVAVEPSCQNSATIRLGQPGYTLSMHLRADSGDDADTARCHFGVSPGYCGCHEAAPR